MSNIKEIRDRMNGIQDTMKITNAMYLIASNKMQKARRSLSQTEPYFYALQSMIARLARHLPPETQDIYLESHAEIRSAQRRRGYLVMTDDKGLAGAYNHNILKIAEEHIRGDGEFRKVYVVGEMGRHFFRTHRIPIDAEFHYTAQNPTLSRARHIADRLMEDYESRAVDEIYIVYTILRNSMICEPQFTKLLPLDIIMRNRPYSDISGGYQEEFLMLPDANTLLHNLIPNYISGFIYGALVEAYSSAQQSRMTAMDSANKNAGEMIHDLQIIYNRERQALITQEITEVTSGARALKRGR